MNFTPPIFTTEVFKDKHPDFLLLENDNLIGSIINNCTVVGVDSGLGCRKKYAVTCNVCSKDYELYKNGIFFITKHNLLSGRLPCGCSKTPKWSEEQYKIILKRYCKGKHFVFKSILGGFFGNTSRVLMCCNTHGDWSSGTIANILRGKGCPECKKVSISKGLKGDEVLITKNLTESGMFPIGTKFKRSLTMSSMQDDYWEYTCPICSNDEYVKAGLCSGIFYSRLTHLKSGIKSCRCSAHTNLTKEQRIFQIKKKMYDSNTKDIFTGLCDNYNNVFDKFIRQCPLHGEYSTEVRHYLHSDCGCPQCSNHSQKECYINGIYKENSLIALKFGIAKNSNLRASKQNTYTEYTVKNINVWTFPTVKSCKEAEKFVKSSIICGTLSKDEFKDGYTETTSVDNMPKIISIFELYGGVLHKN